MGYPKPFQYTNSDLAIGEFLSQFNLCNHLFLGGVGGRGGVVILEFLVT